MYTNALTARKNFTGTKSRRITSCQLCQSQDLTRLTPLLKDFTVTQRVIKYFAKKTTNSKQTRKTVKDANTEKKSRAEQMIHNLEKEEYWEEMAKVLAKALNTNLAVADQYVNIFMLNEEKLLDLVTQSVTIRQEVRKRVLEGVNKSLEKLKK